MTSKKYLSFTVIFFSISISLILIISGIMITVFANIFIGAFFLFLGLIPYVYIFIIWIARKIIEKRSEVNGQRKEGEKRNSNLIKLQKIIDSISGPRMESPDISSLSIEDITVRILSSTKIGAFQNPIGGLSQESSAKNDASILTNQGIELRIQGKYDEAEKYFQKAIQIYPGLKHPYYNLGNLYIEINQYEKGIQFLLKGLMFDKFEIQFYTALASAYLEIREFSKAEFMLKNARSIDPEDFNFLVNYGALLHSTDKFEDSARYHKELLSSGRISYTDKPIYCAVNFNLAMAYGAMQQNLKALSVVDKFLRDKYVLANKHLKILFIQAKVRALQNMERYSEIIKILTTVLAHNPESIICLTELGNTYLMMNRNRDAVEIYRRALKYQPNNTVIIKAISDIESRMNL
ncbi:MAG: tetratricopeptide repeat protein [Candidatus Heimdallarchaeota archaeon]